MLFPIVVISITSLLLSIATAFPSVKVVPDWKRICTDKANGGKWKVRNVAIRCRNQQYVRQEILPGLLSSSIWNEVGVNAITGATGISLGLVPENSFQLTRTVFLRAMAFVHFVAFTVAWRQNKALIGDNGITPARHVLDSAQEYGATKRRRRLEWRNKTLGQSNQQQPEPTSMDDNNNFKVGTKQEISNKINEAIFQIQRKISASIDSDPRLIRIREVLWDRSDRLNRPTTTLLWLAKDRTKMNNWLDGIALIGMITSVIIMILGMANVPMIAALWICQRSLMSVGGPWYGFGWEPQLNELSFHSLFLVPLLNVFNCRTMRVPQLVIWTIRWHLFRIMLGAGLIKFRSGDKKWKDLTAMYYFYETQPVPNPLTRYLHWMPRWWHKGEVLTNHFVECIAPWLLIIPSLPTGWRRAGGLIQLVFQSILISSGNLSFLNWLTMVPAIMCLDDAFLQCFVQSPVFSSTSLLLGRSSVVRQMVSVAFFLLIAQLSTPVVKNLLSSKQIMNNSYDPLRLVNTYGAFGTVGEERDEFIISSAIDWDGPWREYEFKVKPGHIYRKPRWISPYHYRLDWQMWIAATSQTIDRSPWLRSFLAKLLEQNQEVLNLLDSEPWNNSLKKPRYIRIDRYRYKFHRRAKGEKNPPYWERTFVDRVYPRQGLGTIELLKE